MKTLTAYLAVTLAILSSKAIAGSDVCIHRFPEFYCGPVNQISCSYKSRTGSSQTMLFKLPENIDFLRLSYPTVVLKVKGETESFLFNVTTQKIGSITKTMLNYRHPFFVSDIHLSYEKDNRSMTLFNPVVGRMTKDYPPVIKMDCSFVSGR